MRNWPTATTTTTAGSIDCNKSAAPIIEWPKGCNRRGKGSGSQSGSEANKCSNKVGERRLPRPQTRGGGGRGTAGLVRHSTRAWVQWVVPAPCSFSVLCYMYIFLFFFLFCWLASFLIRRVIYEIFSRDIQVAGKRLQRPSHTKHNSSRYFFGIFWYTIFTHFLAAGKNNARTLPQVVIERERAKEWGRTALFLCLCSTSSLTLVLFPPSVVYLSRWSPCALEWQAKGSSSTSSRYFLLEEFCLCCLCRCYCSSCSFSCSYPFCTCQPVIQPAALEIFVVVVWLKRFKPFATEVCLIKRRRTTALRAKHPGTSPRLVLGTCFKEAGRFLVNTYTIHGARKCPRNHQRVCWTKPFRPQASASVQGTVGQKGMLSEKKYKSFKNQKRIYWL